MMHFFPKPNPMSKFTAIPAGALMLLAAMPAANAVGFEILAPHRAVYDVELEQAEDRSGIKAMNGRIVYEVNGNECEGISIRYRFVTNVTTASDLFVTDQQTTTYESPDGKEFSFQTRSFVNEVADEKVQGSAELTEKGLMIKLSDPKKQDLEMDKAMFVSSHLVSVITQAKAGNRFVQTDIFDGSGKADEIVSSMSVIGNRKAVGDTLKGEDEKTVSKFGDQQAWPVTISYFNRQMDNTSESLPIYEASFLLYENGISRDLLMRYPDYSLKAALREIEILKKPTCR